MSAWQPSGIVTLTTDFGLVDPYVGIMHGVILARAPAARIVDLTHAVPPQAVDVGAFFLQHAWRYFPSGSVHVAVVDPGVGSERKLLVARTEEHAFLAPDNGLLARVLAPASTLYELDVARFALPGASRTFHGRDVLAPAAAALANGLAPEDAGLRPWAPASPSAPRVPESGDELRAPVLWIDRYGNVLLDLRPEELAGGIASWSVFVGAHEIPWGATYADVLPGEALALVDSYGVIEIALRDGDAARRLELAPGAHVLIRRRSWS
jgi:S-adenosylmethionine hydrolase